MKWRFWQRPPSLKFSRNIKRRANLILQMPVVIPIIGITIAELIQVAIIAYSIYSIVYGLVVSIIGPSDSSQDQNASGRTGGIGGFGSRDPMSSGHLINTRASSEPLTVPYGDCRIGGNIVYINSTGINNEYLHIVMTVGEGPVKGIKFDELLTLDIAPAGTGWTVGDTITGATSTETCKIAKVLTTMTYRITDRTGVFTLGEILSNGTNAADQGAASPTVGTAEPMIWLDDERIQYYGADAAYEFFTGTGSQNVSTTLQGYDPNWDDAMRYTSYIYVRLHYNESLYASMPQITLRLEGRLLYDPRNGATTYSDNNALAAYDFLRNDRYSIGFPASAFDDASFIDAANWCDDPDNNYKFNGAIMKYQAFIDNEGDILRNFRAGILSSEAEYKLVIYEYDTPIMNLTEDEIVADSFKITIPGIPETPNRCVVNYIDKVDNYLSKQRIISDPTAVLQYDLQERDFSLDLIGTDTAEFAEKLGAYYVERNRLNYQFSFSCAARALALEPLDMIKVTHYLPGWDEAIVRVVDVVYNQGDPVKLTVIAEDSDLYDDTVNIEAHSPYTTNLPLPIFTEPPVYADNAAAIAGGLAVGDVYRLPTGVWTTVI